MANSTVGLTTIKRFTYRGVAEEYSNTYWFDGSTPTDAAAWRTFFDAFVTAESAILPTTQNIIRGYGYNDPSSGHPSVWGVDLTVSPNTIVPGTHTVTGDLVLSGDTAWWLRWKLNKLNSKGKAVYLRKYYHPGLGTTGNPDLFAADMTTATNGFDGAIRTTGIGAANHKLINWDGTTILAFGRCTYNTTRTLKRRGKRPGS